MACSGWQRTGSACLKEWSRVKRAMRMSRGECARSS
jgi:hypothetical protein